MTIRVPAFCCFLLLALLTPLGAAQADCSSQPYCTDIRTCAEAYYHLTVCGLTRLDRDGDGIPCEKTCGKTKRTMAARIAAEPYDPQGGTAVGLLADREKANAFVGGQCGTKRYCKEMLSCAEARFYLEQCGVSDLDGNRDGVPCNGLCRR